MKRKKKQPEFNLLRSLEVFLAVAEQGQLTRAASALNISQSAVSQHLQNLETAYATCLLDRQLRPMQLTLTGQALHQHALEILRQVESVNHDLAGLEQSLIPMLRIALLPSLATLLTPSLVCEAKKQYQVSNISLYADLSSAHQQLIKTRQVDLLITSRAFYDLEGLNRFPILDESFLLILPVDYKFKEKDLERLSRNLPMIRFSPNTPVGLQVDQHLRRCEISPGHFVDADRTTMIMAAVAAGQGFSILSPTLLLDGLIEGMSLQILPLPIPALTRKIMLVHRQDELDQLPQQLCRAAISRLKEALARTPEILQQSVTLARE
ncbi:MAG: LysR family transcriptional regulator [Pseudomonadota bacterium]